MHAVYSVKQAQENWKKNKICEKKHISLTRNDSKLKSYFNICESTPCNTWTFRFAFKKIKKYHENIQYIPSEKLSKRFPLFYFTLFSHFVFSLRKININEFHRKEKQTIAPNARDDDDDVFPFIDGTPYACHENLYIIHLPIFRKNIVDGVLTHTHTTTPFTKFNFSFFDFSTIELFWALPMIRKWFSYIETFFNITILRWVNAIKLMVIQRHGPMVLI